MGHVNGVGEVTDLEMMKNPNWWPGLALPLKAPRWRAGLLLTDDNGHYLFIPDQNMFMPLEYDRAICMKTEWLETLIQQGWKVD